MGKIGGKKERVREEEIERTGVCLCERERHADRHRSWK